jgi:hypothetical protein
MEGHVDRVPLDEIYTLVFSFLFSAWGYRMGVHQYRYFLKFDYLSKIRAKSVVAFACAIIDAAACESTLYVAKFVLS